MMSRRLQSARPLGLMLLVVTLAAMATLAALVIWGASGSRASTPRRQAGADAGGNQFVLSLALKHQAALNRFVGELDRPGSPEYHHFLTPAQFSARFGASPQEVKAVEARLSALGYGDSTISANHLYVTVAAHSGRHANVAGTLSGALGGLISGVITPSQMPTLTPALGAVPHRANAATAPAAVRPGVDGGSTPCQAASDSGGYTAPPLASAYDFNGLYARGLHGEGMSAAVLEFGGYHNTDVSGFSACYGLDTAVNRVLVDGGSGASSNSSETEVALDVEVLLEMAPKLANLYVYEAPNSGTGELAAYNAFVTQDRAPVLSVSWGDCEEGLSQSYERLLATIDEQGAAQGQQIFVAAGDSGSKGCEAQPLPTGGSLSASSEAAMPWVTAVGGTDLSEATAEAGATVHREDVWNDGLGAGGGGQSIAWTMPSWQQNYLAATGDQPAGMANDCNAPSGQDCRMVPDIAMDADAEEGGADPGYWDVPRGPVPAQFSSVGDRGAPGYAIYCVSADCSAGGSGWQRVGGTSAATPLAAAAAVLWDQEARDSGVSLGFLDPAMYSIASSKTSYARDFYDISVGNNDDRFTELSCVAACPSLYSTGPGYDMASGLGAVNVANLGSDLLSSAGAVTLTPSSEHMYGYTGGGPTTTVPVSITMPSAAAASHAYTATSDAAWLMVASGASSPASLMWHVDPAGLAPGTYTGQITVTTPGGSSATLSVTYTVTTPARIRLLTNSLHFSESQIKPAGAKHIKICGVPLWGDELEFDRTLPGLFDVSTPGDEAAGTRRTLAFANGGGAGSQLHFAIDQSRASWVSNDLDPHGKPGEVELTPAAPLVASVGTLGPGSRAGIKLASVANTNTIGGYPSLQQGTYHGTIVIRDLADPADSVRVPVTLTLGSGHGTPTIKVSRRAVSLTVAPGQNASFTLGLSDPDATCGYGYSLQTSADWLSADAQRHAGSVVAHASEAVPFTVNVPAGMAPRLYEATITIASGNAAQALVRVPVKLTVS